MSPPPPPADAGHVPHVPQGQYERTYFFLGGLFVALLLLTNIVGTKLFELPFDLPLVGALLRWVDGLGQRLFGVEGGGTGLPLTAGLITYPLTFLITDVVSEVWGRRRADRIVILGFTASLLMLIVLAVAGALPPSPIWSVPSEYQHVLAPAYSVLQPDGTMTGNHLAAQAAYRFTFDAPGTLLFASMTAYLVAQLIDNRLFHFWRRVTRGRALWFRNNMSTVLSQLVDTAIVNGIFLHFYWELPAAQIAAIILNVYAVKALLALLDTPFCYALIALVRARMRRPA